MRFICCKWSRIDRSVYIDEVEDNTTKNSMDFWNYVNKLSKSNAIPDEMFFRNVKSENAKSTCNLFARNFELIYLQSESSFVHQLLLNNNLDFTISLYDITSTILQLKNKKNYWA